jgi:hypothetical protein
MNYILLFSLFLIGFSAPLIAGERPLQPIILINVIPATPRVQRNDNHTIQDLNAHIRVAYICHFFNALREHRNREQENRNAERDLRNTERERRNLELENRNAERERLAQEKAEKKLQTKQYIARLETIASILYSAAAITLAFTGLAYYFKNKNQKAPIQK